LHVDSETGRAVYRSPAIRRDIMRATCEFTCCYTGRLDLEGRSCGFRGTYTECVNHEEEGGTCASRTCACPSEGCQWDGPMFRRHSHLLVCEYKGLQKCASCGRRSRPHDLDYMRKWEEDDHGLFECIGGQVSCPLCTWRGSREDLVVHLPEAHASVRRAMAKQQYVMIPDVGRCQWAAGFVEEDTFAQGVAGEYDITDTTPAFAHLITLGACEGPGRGCCTILLRGIRRNGGGGAVPLHTITVHAVRWDTPRRGRDEVLNTWDTHELRPPAEEDWIKLQIERADGTVACIQLPVRNLTAWPDHNQGLERTFRNREQGINVEWLPREGPVVPTQRQVARCVVSFHRSGNE